MPPIADTRAEAARLERSLRAMRESRQRAYLGRESVAALFDEGAVGDWELAPRYVRDLAVACRLCTGGESRQALRRLVYRIESHAGRLLHDRDPEGRRGYALPLLRLAEEVARWRADPADWRPHGSRAGMQLAHLARFLLGEAGQSDFLASLSGLPPASRVDSWLGHLLRGEHMRPSSGSLQLTRRMAIYFLEPPARQDLIRSLRRAQVLGLGGEERLARAWIHSGFGWQLWQPEDEQWWEQALRWVIAHPELGPEDLPAVTAYLRERRFGDAEGRREPEPRLSVKGRTPAALLRLAREWASTAAVLDGRAGTEFRPCGLRPARWETGPEGTQVIWQVREILDGFALREEALRMHHCVAMYADSIRRGRSAVWSMTRTAGGVTRRALTIRVSPASGQVVECRGIHNRPPREQERRILLMWAAENGLSVRL